MAEENPYRYAGYRYDVNTKLYYLMARYYNPDNSVFLSVDPVRGDLRNPVTLNGYNYANNNPVMMIDPDGNAAVVAIYFIPGIGQVALLATGAFILGGLTYKAGSWLGNKVRAYLAKKDLPKQKKGNQIKGTPRNNQAQNKQTNDAAKKYKLNKQQERELHDAVTGQNYGYKEIERIAKEIKYGTW